MSTGDVPFDPARLYRAVYNPTRRNVRAAAAAHGAEQADARRAPAEYAFLVWSVYMTPERGVFYNLGGPNWDEHKHQKVDIPHEEQQKNWWDLDEKRKKELEVYPYAGSWHAAVIHKL